MNLDKIKIFQKYREYLNTGNWQLSKEEELIIVQEYDPMMNYDNLTHENCSNENSFNDNLTNDNSSDDNSFNDNLTNDNSSNVNFSNDNLTNGNLKSPKKVLIIVDFDLSLYAENTIWCCNFINSYLNDGIDVHLLTTNHNKQTEIFKKNLNKEINIYHESSIYNFVERKTYDKIIIRNDSFISGLKINESWINKVVLYIINEKIIPNEYQGKIITQNDKLKRKIMERNINEEQIEIEEPEGYNDNSNNDNSSNDNSSNDNLTNDNSSDDNSSDDNSSNDNSSNDNLTNDNSSDDNSSDDNYSNVNSSNDNSSNVNSFNDNSSNVNSSNVNSFNDNSWEYIRDENKSQTNGVTDDEIKYFQQFIKHVSNLEIGSQLISTPFSNNHINEIYSNKYDKQIYKDNNKTKIIITTCVYGRHDILKKCLNHYSSFNIYKFIAVYSNDEDLNILKQFPFVTPVYHKNVPLSHKWNCAVYSCKKYNPDAVVITGSDDLLSKNYINFVKKNILEYKLIGLRCWSNLYLNNDHMLLCRTFYSIHREDPVGVGRSINKALLNELDWNIYNFNSDSSLDGKSYKIMIDKLTKKDILLRYNYSDALLIKDVNQKYSVTFKSNYKTIFSYINKLNKNTNKHSIIIDCHKINYRYLNSFILNFIKEFMI